MAHEFGITVVICTYNRAESLRALLNDLNASEIPVSVLWEVLVVDNNSTDGTREVVDEFQALHPGRFRYVFESHPGKSFALNTGVREARGEILAFVDDDVMIGPTWLRNLTSPLEADGWAGVGGRVLLQWNCRPPYWLAIEGPYNLAGLLAQFDLGDRALPLGRAPIGANMAFRKSIFEKYGGFRTDLGPSPDPAIPRPNEDTEFGRRLMAAGEDLHYEPSATAYHGVPSSRLRKEYFLAWWFDYGRAVIREGGRKRDVMRIPRSYLTIIKIAGTMLVVNTVRWVFATNPQKRFYSKAFVWCTAGQIAELYRQRERPPLVEAGIGQTVEHNLESAQR